MKLHAALVLGCGLAILASSVTVRAQTASQITPPSFRPSLERQGGLVIPGTQGLATPDGAEKLFVRLSGVQIKGGLPQLATATAALQAKLTGRSISGAEVFAAARELEAAYAAAGYILVRVVLPPQQLVNGGRLQLVVIDGFVERIETKDLPGQVRERVTTLISPLVGRRALTRTEIERAILLASDTPGLILRSTLTPGNSEGGTVLMVDGKYQAVSATLNFDNSLSKALGRTTLGVGLDLNSVAGLGELIYLRAAGHPSGGVAGFFDAYPRNRTLAAGVILPLWLDGLTFNAEYTDARTTPLPTGGIRTTSEFKRLSLRIRYAWLRGRSANFSSELAFDAQEEMQSLFQANTLVPLSEDRLRVIRFVNEGDVLTPWGATVSGRATASFGIDALDARMASSASVLLPLSRQGADATFEKLDISLNYQHAFLDHLAVSLTVRAQTSFGKPLLRSEQIGIANTSGLSAFDSGTIVGDQGFVLRGELISPWQLPQPDISLLPGDPVIGVSVAPYLFAAYGEVSMQQPTALEPAHVRATSFGGGLRFSGAAVGTASNGYLGLEYGYANRNDNVPAGHRFTVATMFRF